MRLMFWPNMGLPAILRVLLQAIARMWLRIDIAAKVEGGGRRQPMLQQASASAPASPRFTWRPYGPQKKYRIYPAQP